MDFNSGAQHPQEPTAVSPTKSWKREVALATLLFWAAITVKMFYMVDDPRPWEGMWNMLTVSTFGLVGSVFAIHHIAQRPKPPTNRERAKLPLKGAP